MRSLCMTAAALALAAGLASCAGFHSRHGRLVTAPAHCADRTVQIYFDAESAELTPEGRAVIEAAAGAARPCRVGSVEVLGLADAVGAPDANLDLSNRRAHAVAAALAAAGLPAAQYRLAAAGQAGAITPSGHAAPLRRRADVVLHLAPP